MKVTPRGPEWKAVVAIMEDDSYDSAEKMAKAIVKEVAWQFAEREWFSYVHRMRGGLTLAWGPLSSEGEVHKLAEKAGLPGDHMALKLYSSAALLNRIQEASEAVGKDAGICATPGCGHPHGTHMHEKRIGQCQVQGCKCTSDTK